MTESLETQIIKKLNKILKQENMHLEIVHDKDSWMKSAVRWYSDFQNTQSEFITGWGSMSEFLFGSASIFEKPRLWSMLSFDLDAGDSSQCFKRIISLVNGSLAGLKNCSSLEEVLLKLDVMFPDAH